MNKKFESINRSPIWLTSKQTHKRFLNMKPDREGARYCSAFWYEAIQNSTYTPKSMCCWGTKKIKFSCHYEKAIKYLDVHRSNKFQYKFFHQDE